MANRPFGIWIIILVLWIVELAYVFAAYFSWAALIIIAILSVISYGLYNSENWARIVLIIYLIINIIIQLIGIIIEIMLTPSILLILIAVIKILINGYITYYLIFNKNVKAYFKQHRSAAEAWLG